MCRLNTPADTSTRLKRDNSLRQFNYAQILGIPTPVGMVPVIYYLKYGECDDAARTAFGNRGVIFYGDSYDSMCFLYPQQFNKVDCAENFIYKYDGIECVTSDVIEGERWFERNKGMGQITVPFIKRFYNGTVMYRAPYKLKKCAPACCDSYFYQKSETTPETTEQPIRTRHVEDYPIIHKVILTTPKGCSTCGGGK